MTEQELKTPHEKDHRVPRVSVGARVRIEVEVDADGGWGFDTQVDQVIRQGGESAVGKVRRALEGIGGRIVGAPDVRVIWAEQRKP